MRILLLNNQIIYNLKLKKYTFIKSVTLYKKLVIA